MDKVTSKEIGKRLNTLLAVKNLMQKELAEILGVTPNTISYFTKGDRTPNVEQIIKISRDLNVSADYILGLSDVSTRNETIQAINEKTALSQDAIATLIAEKVSEDFLLADFISFLISNRDSVVSLINAIVKTNQFNTYPNTCRLDIGEGCDMELDMGAIFQTYAEKTLWEIVSRYKNEVDQ